MKFPQPIPVKKIAKEINAKIIGDDSLMVTGINEIHKVQPGDIIFVDLEKYFKKSLSSAASVIILNEETECPPGKALLVCEQPFEAYESILHRYRPYRSLVATIDPSAKIDASATIEPGAIIGPDTSIGPDTCIEAGAVVREHCHIGSRCMIQSGAIIGTDAFYFKRRNPGYIKWTSGGRVIVHDDVYIGAGSTINRGVSGDTVIGRGTKIDCLVQLGHGVVIGEDCMIMAQAGIGGKTIIGDRCTLQGQVGVAHNLVIGDDVIIQAKSGVHANLASGKAYMGIPAEPARQKWKEWAAIRRLPELLRKLDRAT